MAYQDASGHLTGGDRLALSSSPWSLYTGVIDGCVLSIDPNDSTKVKNTAGHCLYVDCSDPNAPIVEVLAIPETSTVPVVEGAGLSTLFLAWMGFSRVSSGVGAMTFSTGFSDTDRRRIAVAGRTWATGIGESTIAAVANYTAPVWGAAKSLEDIICALGGAVNIEGNNFTAHDGQLTLDKSEGSAFRMYGNAGTSRDAPNCPACPEILPVTSYRYWATAGSTYGNVLRSTIDPNYYDHAGTRTVVPNSKWTIQRVYYFPGSSTVAVAYGQTCYNTLAAAKAEANSSTVVVNDIADRMFKGGLLRARLYVQQGMTNLLSAYIEQMPAFMAGGAMGGTAMVVDHATLTNLDYANAGHTGFVPDTRTIDGEPLTSNVVIPGRYGGFYAYNKAIAFNIATAGVYHAFGSRSAGDITTGILSGFTVVTGGIVDSNITSESNPSGNVLRIVCSTNHLLTTGDIVTTSNMNNAAHNGATRVTVVNATTFDCQNIPYVSGAGTSSGVIMTPACLTCQDGAEGVYFANFVIDGTAAFINKDWKWELNVNLTPSDNIVAERTSTNTLASMSSSGNITLVAGDRIWLSGKNSTDSTDYTVKNMNLNMHKIGPLPT